MTDTIIQEEFDRFCLQCFGNVSHQQYIDLRRTFFGGAAAVLTRAMNQLSPGDEPTDDDLEMMRSINREFEEFGKAVLRGEK